MSIAKEIVKLCAKNVFWTHTKNKHKNCKTKNQTSRHLPESGMEPLTYRTQIGCVNSRPPNESNESIDCSQAIINI